MSYRSSWKGFLKLAQIVCPVKLYRATAEADAQKFTAINPKTGNKLDFHRVDTVTGEHVDYKNMGKGIEVATGVYARVTDEEIENAAPPSVHTIEIRELVPRGGLSWLYPDALYYLGPDGLAAGEAFGLIRDGIKQVRNHVALGQVSLGNREHLIMLEPGKLVLRLSTLRYAAELRSEEICFPDLVDVPYPDELAGPVAKILAARSSEQFEPERFTDRYAAAIAELVREKIAGKTVRRMVAPPPRLIDLRKAVSRSFDHNGKPHGNRTDSAGRAARSTKKTKRGRAA